MKKWYPYIQIARPDHWFKNIFMVPGILLYFFFHPEMRDSFTWVPILTGFMATCLIASSNYVMNEILDAPKDCHHPVKQHRPVPSGQVKISLGWLWWGILSASGLLLGIMISMPFFTALLGLWVAGCAYNVPPVRTKDKPYLDVLSESINNPLRLLLGWYSTGFGAAPPASALLAYWMFGGFLMALKRFAEYRTIANEQTAADYRKSFGFYNEERLLVSVLFYVAFFALLSGYFIARYKVELILAAPAVAFTMAYYFRIGFKPNSPVQFPEHLWRQKGLMITVFTTFALCSILLFIQFPRFQETISPRIIPPEPHLFLHPSSES